jgi:hypothetical protein
MVSERYWDVSGCCWRPCHANDPGSSRSSGVESDMAVLGLTSPAAVPTTTGPAATSADPAQADVTGPAEV